MSKFSFLTTSCLVLFFVIFTSCDTESPFKYEPPDLSTVPPAFDTTGVESVEIEEGVKAYVYDEGHGPFKITQRDQVRLYLTLRSDTGDIIYSTYSDDDTTPHSVSMSIADGTSASVYTAIASNLQQSIYPILLAYTPGFKESLLGAPAGKKMTLVVSPEKGFKNIPKNTVNIDYNESTLIYDIKISEIGPTKSR